MTTAIIVTIAIVEVFQIITLFAALIEDTGVMDYDGKDEKYLTTKRRVLQFFVPFFWVPATLRAIVRWWNGLK